MLEPRKILVSTKHGHFCTKSAHSIKLGIIVHCAGNIEGVFEVLLPHTVIHEGKTYTSLVLEPIRNTDPSKTIVPLEFVRVVARKAKPHVKKLRAKKSA